MNLKKISFLIIVMILPLIIISSNGQQDTFNQTNGSLNLEQNSEGNGNEPFNSNEDNERSNFKKSSLQTDEDIVKSIIALGFGALMLLMVLVYCWRVPNLTTELVQLIILMLVIFASMFFMAAGWDNQQAAPAFGILGTIVGYLMGKNQSVNNQSKEDNITASKGTNET